MKSEVQQRLVFRAAWLYYMQNKLQSEVANILGVSRASVALYLKHARESGMVRISLDKNTFKEHKVSIDIETHFNIESAFVLSRQNGSNTVLDELANLGAEVLISYLENGDKLGIAWGLQLYELAACLPRKKFTNLEVIQLCGNLGAPFGYAPEQCTLEIANKLEAQSRNLYAPLSLSTPELATALRNEPIIADQLRVMATCTKAVFSIGTCDNDSHAVRCGAINVDEMKEMRKKGAHAFIAGRLIDNYGNPMQDISTDRTIGIDLHALKKIPLRLVVAGGTSKVQAIHAALKGGYATHLVIDEDTAEKVLALE